MIVKKWLLANHQVDEIIKIYTKGMNIYIIFDKMNIRIFSNYSYILRILYGGSLL